MEYMCRKSNQLDKYKFFHFKSYFQNNLYNHLDHTFHNINRILSIMYLLNHHNSDICKGNLEHLIYPVHKLNNLVDLKHKLNIYNCMPNRGVN